MHCPSHATSGPDLLSKRKPVPPGNPEEHKRKMKNGPGTYHLLHDTYRVASTYHLGMEVSSMALPRVREPLKKDWSLDLCQLCLAGAMLGYLKKSSSFYPLHFFLAEQRRGDDGLIYLIHPKMLTPGTVSG